MRLSSLYSNRPDVFRRIDFGPGLNVVIAEIRLPGNSDKDTHNLGKTTLGSVIDFCLMKGMDASFFLAKRKELFPDLVFFLEIELLDGGYVTARRDVGASSKAWFKFHEQPRCDFVDLPETDWDQPRLPFERAVRLLDGALDLRDLGLWGYRKLVGYLIRNQNDYQDVFQLSKFKGKESDWKPFLAKLLGFDADRVTEHYQREADLETAVSDETTVKSELGGSVEDLSKVEGLLLLRQEEVAARETELEQFSFRRADAEKAQYIVDRLDETIAALNAEQYNLIHARHRIVASLEDQTALFDSGAAAGLFAEAGVLFEGQIRRDFDQLLAFNRAISEERVGYLSEELRTVEQTLDELASQLALLDGERKEALAFLSDKNALAKYKRIADGLVSMKAEVLDLERQRRNISRLQKLRAEIKKLNETVVEVRQSVIEDVERQNADKSSMFSSIRLRFNQIVRDVIDRRALLTVAPNRLGHLEFRAEILDEHGRTSDADTGTSYRKLLCIALDLAVLRARLDGKCSRFVFHDGVFESLDNRKKENLLRVMREYADAGVQQVITLIETDLPRKAGVFDEDEIILRLHDDGEDGRLFRMTAW